MIRPAPVVLRGNGVILEPLRAEHAPALARAAADGELWNLAVTSVPSPADVDAYVADALGGQAAGHMLPWVVRDEADGRIVGSTRYHDILPSIDRVEIGYTWYAKRAQGTFVNPAAKHALFYHAFVELGCAVVGLRTDAQNHHSQAAIAKLGARRDGTIRHWGTRRDGSARDTVMYSVLRAEWPAVDARLTARLRACSKAIADGERPTT